MTAPLAFPRPTRRLRRTAAIVIGALAVAALIPVAAPPGAATAAPGGAAWESAASESAASTSATSEGNRAQYHFTVPDHWKNDPQRPLYVNGAFNYYYLYNGDYDQKVGTAWRLATTTDNVMFADQGVVADKGTNANYDLWSGSAVLDSANTAGYGADAIIMLVTQMDHPTPAQIANASGPQAQFLWYSTDGGLNFQPAGDTPVIPNGGRTDFRDPKVIWDADRGRWVALIAEGQKIGFYTSPNLTDWTRTSEYVNTGLGTLECPDLFQITADDGTSRWVMGISANGYATDEPNTYAYWTGTFDGSTFVPDVTAPQWLDHGFDWYGAVTWADPTNAANDSRFAMAWMNNWSYPHVTPNWPADGFNGTDSIVREISLKRYGTGYSLVSQPVAALEEDHATSVRNLGTFAVNGQLPLDYEGSAYQLEADISWADVDNVGLQLRASTDDSRHADVGVFDDFAYLNRGGTGNPDASGQKLESQVPFDPAAKNVHLRILVDRTTVEVFVNDGRYVMSSEVFADAADTGINLFTSGGAATFSDVTITEFASVAQRPARVLADFEGTTWGEGWTATGSFAGQGPSGSTAPGTVGSQVLNSYVGGGDTATGTITSAPFTIDRSSLRFLIGGGAHPLGVEPATSVNLLVNGQPVRTATGNNDGTLRPVKWDLTDLAGQSAQLQVLDDATGAWGHLVVDQAVLSD